MKTLFAMSFICVLCFAASAQHVSSRDVLYTKDGEEFRGELGGISEEGVLLRMLSGERAFPREEVVRIELAKKRPGDWWLDVSEIDDPVLIEVLDNIPDPAGFMGAGYLVLLDRDEYTIHSDGTVEHISRKITHVYSERSKDEVSLSHALFFADLGSGEFIHGRSILPDGRVLHLDESAIETGPIYAYIPDYNRLTLTKCALGEVGPGNIVDISNKTVQRFGSPLDPFYAIKFFAAQEPILKRELVLRVEAGAPIKYSELNLPPDWKKVELADEGEFTVFKWSRENILPIIPESNMPPDVKITPAVALTTVESWELISTEFHAALKEAIDCQAAIDELSKDLTKGKKTPEAKAKAIYEWVVGEVRYIEVPARHFGWRPRKISASLEKKYANDLDKAVLFYSLCQSAGLDADFGFASVHGTSFSREVPSLGFAPVPVVRLNLSGKAIWAELSSEGRPMGVMPTEVMGEPAVVFPRPGEVEFSRIELPRTTDEGEEESLVGEISPDGDLTAEIKIRYNGSRQEAIREFNHSTDEEIRREMEQRVAQVHSNAVMTDWSVSGIDDLDEPVEVRIKFVVPSYAITAGEKFLAFGVPNLKYSAWGTGKPQRDWPVWFDTPFRGTHDVQIKLPKGYEIYYIPSDTSSVGDSILYSARWESGDGSIRFFDDYDRPRLSFPPELYPVYQDYRKVQAATASAWVVLSKD